MLTEIQKQEEAVRIMKESPCQCLEYHPKVGTTRYNELLNEWKTWRSLSNKQKGKSDKDWIIIYLLASQNCPYIKEEGKTK